MGKHPKTLTLILPDWVDEKTSIHVVAGDEVVAKRLSPDHPLVVKTQRCSRCGMCCLYENYNFTHRDPDDGGDGRCQYVEVEDTVDGRKVWRCAHPEQPWSCVRGSGQEMVAERYADGKHPRPDGLVVGSCSIRFEEVK